MSHKHHSLRIITIYVENRRLHHLGNICAIHCGTGIERIAGSKANLVIDHNMQGPPGEKASRLGHIEVFHNHALTGEGGIPMDQYWHPLIAQPIPTPLLACPYRALHDWIYNL